MNRKEQEELLNEHWWEHMSHAEYVERLYNSGQKSLAKDLEKKRKRREKDE